jgi:hypothetical protein
MARDLRREKALQAPDALDFGNLFGHPLLEGLIPAREVGCLRQHAIVERLQAQGRSHSGRKRRLVYRLCQIFVGASVEPSHDVLGVSLCCHQGNGHEWKCTVAFEAATNLDTVEFRHHDIEQNEVWKQRFRRIERLLAIDSLAQVIALGGEPRREDVTVGLVVVDEARRATPRHNNAMAIAHDERKALRMLAGTPNGILSGTWNSIQYLLLSLAIMLQQDALLPSRNGGMIVEATRGGGCSKTFQSGLPY